MLESYAIISILLSGVGERTCATARMCSKQMERNNSESNFDSFCLNICCLTLNLP